MIRSVSLDTWEMDYSHPMGGDGKPGGGSGGTGRCQASALGIEFEVSLGGDGQGIRRRGQGQCPVLLQAVAGDAMPGETLRCLCL